MDKLKGVTKGGWHPSGDRSIHRDTWKSDLKGIATGKKNDPYAEARNHQSAPLATLKDPDSFGPPPKHSAYYGSEANASSSLQTLSQPSGLGARVPARPRQTDPVEEQAKPAVPYRTDTTGLRTDNLPKPPTRSIASGQPSTIQRPTPSLPPRQASTPTTTSRPPPVLPPRQNEYPDEHTAPPPPPYTAAATQLPQASNLINQDAVRNLGRAGVNVPGFGITSASQSSSQAGVSGAQVSELQQRFAKMNTQNTADALSPVASRLAGAAAQKKPPPPPPKPKAPGLAGTDVSGTSANGPPPIPLSSKPRS